MNKTRRNRRRRQLRMDANFELLKRHVRPPAGGHLVIRNGEIVIRIGNKNEYRDLYTFKVKR